VFVEAVPEGDETVVRVRDDGAGFDVGVATPGLGLQGMCERAALAGGRVAIHAAPGRGTTIELRIGAGRDR
jgi:signal transduction histidine kinase